MLHISADQPFGVHYYTLFHIAAILMGVVFAGFAALKSKFGIREFAVIVSSGILALTIGSKLMMFDGSQWNYWFTQFHLPEEDEKSTFGALLGMIIGLWFAGKLLGKNKSVLNLFALSLPLGLAVQGLACLSSGCCRGGLTDLPWGITYGPGTRPFIEQQQLGLISSDAATSLAVHPNQIYTLLVCVCITLIVWRRRSLWKSPSGNFMFSIILFLVYRVIEGLAPYSLPAMEWMGMNSTVWKALFLFLFSLLFIYQEWKARRTKYIVKDSKLPVVYFDLKIFSLALIIFIISIQLGDWFSSSEGALMLLIILPLCGLVILGQVMRTVMHLKYLKPSMLAILALAFMSQTTDFPSGTPKSYTSVNLTSIFGQYDIDHLFDKHRDTDCNGNPYLYGENVGYHHTYAAGGIGISRKEYYTKWRSTLLSINVFGGRETENPFYNLNPEVNPSKFKSTIWVINPQFQFDTRGIGLGLGASIGNVSYDKEYNLNNLNDYTPKGDGRDFVLQTRLRFFSERILFLEMLGGYDAGATGEYNLQALAGSRFNSDKYLLKAGFAMTEHSEPSIVLKGEMLLAPNLFLSPQFTFYKKDGYNIHYEGGGYRAVIGLEYRLHDKDQSKIPQ